MPRLPVNCATLVTAAELFFAPEHFPADGLAAAFAIINKTIQFSSLFPSFAMKAKAQNFNVFGQYYITDQRISHRSTFASMTRNLPVSILKAKSHHFT